MHRIITFSIMLAWFFSACSPEPVFRLSPQSDKTSFYKGVEYIHLGKDSLYITLSYYRHTSDLFILDVEIVNESDQALRVDPSAFTYRSYTGVNPERITRFINQKWAKDPELKLLEIDKQLSRIEASQKTDEILFYSMQGLSIAASAINKDPEQREKLAENRTENRIEQEIDREEYRYNRYSLQDQREIWELDALRISDIMPGEHIRGYVFFPNQPDATLYQITLEFGKTSFESWFKQKKIKP